MSNLLKEKASNTTPLSIPPHGSVALLNNPALEPSIFSAMPTVTPGLMGFLMNNGHVRTSMLDNPVFGVMTGQLASTGTEPTTGCDPNITIAGALKLCQQMYPFGEYTKKSQVIQVDRAGSLSNRGEMVDQRLINNPFLNVGAPTGMTAEQIFRDRHVKAVMEALYALNRDYVTVKMYTGNPANTLASTGGYQENKGLLQLINNNYVDAVTGARCEASDSLVLDYSNQIVSNTGPLFVQRIIDMVRSRKYRGNQVGIDFIGALVMRYSLFVEAATYWPCSYATVGCSNGDIDTTFALVERNRLLNNFVLTVDGADVRVIIDDSLPELNVGGGNFASSVLYVPLASPRFGDTDGMLTYIQNFDYRGPLGMQSLIDAMNAQETYKTSSDGRYAFVYRSEAVFCKDVVARERFRIILRTPFLAARLDNVVYGAAVKEASPFPGTSFFVNGGNSSFFR